MVTPTELQFMLRNLGIELRDDLIDGLMKEASHNGEQNNMKLSAPIIILQKHAKTTIYVLVEGKKLPYSSPHSRLSRHLSK